MNADARIIEEIDCLGRIVIPKDFRECLLLERTVELILTKDGILLRNPKHESFQKEDSPA